MKTEPGFFKRLYRKHIPGQTNKYVFAFSVPIVTSKIKIQVQFHPDAPTLAYHQHDQISCFINLASIFIFERIFDEN